MKRLLMVIVVSMMMLGSACSAVPFSQDLNGKDDTLDHVGPLNDISNSVQLADGVKISGTSYILGTGVIEKSQTSRYFYCKKHFLLDFGAATYFAKEITGVNISIYNDSDKFYRIKWSESQLNIGSFSCMPFLSGMKYIDAGKPEATPDTLLPPHTVTTMPLYTSSMTFSDGVWAMNGILIPVDNSLAVTVYVKLYDDANGSKYYTVPFCHMGWMG